MATGEAAGQRGFTLLGLLFLVAGMGIGLAALGSLWHTAAQREKEQELLFIGDQFRRAIDSFWKVEAGGGNRLPKDFNELIADPRFPGRVRHLRRVYLDPMTKGMEWGVVKGPDGGISGVYSLSEGKPFKTAGFTAPYQEFEQAQTYRDWVFQSQEAEGKEEEASPAKPAAPAPQPQGPQAQVTPP